MEWCFDLKPPHREDRPLPPAGLKFKIVITGLKKANIYGVVVCSAKSKLGKYINV
jgi:hypothetical protein